MKQAFSLVELSIVLVILGLLTGGILSGQSLIRGAELRSTITDYQRYIVAHHAFVDKYFEMPGDMTQATKFWGFASGSTGTDNACYNAVSNDARTCNGDGNGQIVGPSGNEYFRYWQHLANAGLLEGSFRGTSGANFGAPMFAPGQNVPAAKISGGAMWFTANLGADAGTVNSFATSGGNYLRLTSTSMPLKPEENWNLDVKMDDGLPHKGKMITYKGDTTARCTTTWGQPVAADVNAAYNVSLATKACAPIYFF